jgi:anaerobic selenocysteine-containing dehydrogenase
MAKKNGTTRREFLGRAAVAGCSAFAAYELDPTNGLVARALAGDLTETEAYQLSKAEHTLYTACLNCNTGCGIKVKVLGGVAAKIDGSPYNPFSAVPHLPMSTDLATAASADTGICPKGQSVHQGAYDPYRIRKVLKRAGRRGEGKWISIPFDQAIAEIVNGGTLFANVPGEEGRIVTGLKDVYALRDKPVMDAMGVDVAAIRKKTLSVADFKAKWAAHLDKLIDPDHPDFGPKNNQFVYMWGRKKGGRSDFAKRFYEAFGTANFHGHTTVCQGSLYFACKAMSEQYDGASFSGGQKFYWQADLENAEYVVFVGANLFDANYGPSNRTPRMTQRLADGTLEIAVVDPRCTKLASKANGAWIPVKPGTDGAFAMGVTRWILENGKFDAKYLANANKAAAAIDRETTWSNAAWLVKVGADGRPGAFVRGSEVGLPVPATGEYVVVSQGGVLVPVDPNSTTTPVEGDLFVDTTVGSLRLKSSLQIMKETAQEKTIGEYAALCGIDAGFIEEVAFKLTSHGKRAAVDVHRGPAQHTNGFYAISALMNLNVLLGNFDWTGGMMAFSAYNYDGTKTTAQPFNLSTLKPPAGKAFGLSIIRHDAKYEESTIFSGYPAKRNWWPLSSDVYQEILPSAADAYPYPIKVLFSYMGAPTYSLPAGQTQIQALLNLEAIPLYFASDITVGPTSHYADYVFPDLHSLERWEMQGSHPNMAVKVQPVRQPVIASPNEIVTVFGEPQPISYETVWLALAEKLGVPGFGPNGFAPGQSLNRPDDFYLRCVANLAWDGVPVADATEEDLRIFTQTRLHLPPTVYDPARWQAIAGTSWPKVVTLLTRGGRFDNAEAAFKGDQVANKYGKMICLYQEKTAKAKDAFTGKGYYGMGRWVPVVDTLDRPPPVGGHELQLITQKDVRMTKSRTITHPYLNHHMPENTVIVSASDAQRLGLAAGQLVKVVSSTNPAGEWNLGSGNVKPMVGRVQVTEGIRPGVVTFTVGHGMWGNGASVFEVDGHNVRPDLARQGGLNANAAMWVDPNLGNTCMIDKVGGSVSFYDTKVSLIPVNN